MLLAQCLKKKLEGVGFGAGNKIAHNRSETVGKQGGVRPGGVGGVLIAQGCLDQKISRVAMLSGDGLETGPALPV